MMPRRGLFAAVALSLMFWLLCGSVVLMLTGCKSTTPGVAASPIPTIVAAEAALAASGRVALAYLTLPVCVPNAPATACGQPALRAKIKMAFDDADGTVQNAQAVADAGGTPNMTAMTAAMTALQLIMIQIPPAK